MGEDGLANHDHRARPPFTKTLERNPNRAPHLETGPNRSPSTIGLLVTSTGCTTSRESRRPDGSTEYLIACGAGLGWNICYDKANERCPSGYKTLSEDAGFNRKELRIACPGAQQQPK